MQEKLAVVVERDVVPRTGAVKGGFSCPLRLPVPLPEPRDEPWDAFRQRRARREPGQAANRLHRGKGLLDIHRRTGSAADDRTPPQRLLEQSDQGPHLLTAMVADVEQTLG